MLNALYALCKLQEPNCWKNIPVSSDSEESLVDIWIIHFTLKQVW